jgi:hypothetical protein
MVIEGGYAGKIPEQMAPLLEGIHRSLAYGHEMAPSFNQLIDRKVRASPHAGS